MRARGTLVVAAVVAAALTCSAGIAVAGTGYEEREFSWEGRGVAGLPSADAIFAASGLFPRTWRRRKSSVDTLVFGTNAGRFCRLRITVRADFTAAAATTPESFVAGIYPSEPPFLISRGSRSDATPRSAVRDESAWRYGLRRPVMARKSAFLVRWAQLVGSSGGQTIWSIISVDAVSLPGAGACGTGYYREARLRNEMENVASTLRMTATIV